MGDALRTMVLPVVPATTAATGPKGKSCEPENKHDGGNNPEEVDGKTQPQKQEGNQEKQRDQEHFIAPFFRGLP
jgi:hypothetical protein